MLKNRSIFLFVLFILIILSISYSIYLKYDSKRVINNNINIDNVNVTNTEIKQVDDTTQAVVHNITPNQVIKSPLIITGRARGNWFFEASFPIKLLDQDKKEIVTAVAQAKGYWMTTDFVDFTATLKFNKPNSGYGFIVFKKDNPSGLPENDQEIFIPIKF